MCVVTCVCVCVSVWELEDDYVVEEECFGCVEVRVGND